MKQKKLLQKLAYFFDLDSQSKAKKKEELKILLSRLKAKELTLIARSNKVLDEDKKRKLAQKIAVLHLQRKKGIQSLKELVS